MTNSLIKSFVKSALIRSAPSPYIFLPSSIFDPKFFTRSRAGIVLLFFSLTSSSFAQNTATLCVGGEVITPSELSLQDFASYKKASHKVKDRDGKEHEFSGVALIEILKKAGVTTGSQVRGKNLTQYVLITAADGYEVLYSLAEIDPEFTDQLILIAIQKDDQQLTTGEGPFRIITPNDKKPSRWIREVRAIKVVFATH